MSEIKLGKYLHYKGGLYQVLIDEPVRHSETGEEGVVYIPLYDAPKRQPNFRPLSMFFGTVDIADGIILPRFEFTDNEELISRTERVIEILSEALRDEKLGRDHLYIAALKYAQNLPHSMVSKRMGIDPVRLVAAVNKIHSVLSDKEFVALVSV